MMAELSDIGYCIVESSLKSFPWKVSLQLLPDYCCYQPVFTNCLFYFHGSIEWKRIVTETFYQVIIPLNQILDFEGKWLILRNQSNISKLSKVVLFMKLILKVDSYQLQNNWFVSEFLRSNSKLAFYQCKFSIEFDPVNSLNQHNCELYCKIKFAQWHLFRNNNISTCKYFSWICKIMVIKCMLLENPFQCLIFATLCAFVEWVSLPSKWHFQLEDHF